MSLISDFWNLLFPPLCIGCEKRLVKNEKYLCLPCHENIPVTDYHKTDNNKLENYLAGRFPFVNASVYARFVKEGIIQKLIHELKYGNNPDMGLFMGRLCGNNLIGNSFIEDIDLLIPVPLHSKKEKKRGYNQSLMIAQGISEVIKIPVNNHNLIRIANNPTQTNKNRFERQENVKDIFEVRNRKDLQGKHILIVDDVITTGATIESCVKTIYLLNSDIRVSIYAVGWAAF